MSSHSSLFAYCPHCSGALQHFTDAGVDRRKCSQCSWVQYRNPTVGVAVVVMDSGRLLLAHRRDGGWCIPCGHVEWDESIEQAARREMAEETGLEVALEGVLAVKSNFHNRDQQTVGIWFRGTIVGGDLRPGSDVVDAAFFDIFGMPPLKFPTDRAVVQQLHQYAAC